ncbi:MAG TPA: hypothetical protein VEB40_10030 [Flavipsychrobacter sp.]|nr:hypothetical protein [Flavipsychrobacter sp.]
MSKFVFSAILIFAAATASGANDSLKVNVRNKWCSHKDTIFVYEGGFNTIQVFGKEINAKEVRIRSLSSKLKIGETEVKGDTAQAIAMPTDIEDPMKLAVVNKRSGQVIREITVYGDKLPEPRARLGNKIAGGIVDKKAVLDESYIRVYYPNSDYCYPYKILRYTFKAKKGTVPMERDVTGFDIPTDVKMLIKNLPVNGVAEFTDIIAVCPECYEKRLKNIKIVLK